MLIGEQPGDQEDRQGHPFVGPAGRVLWRCVEEAGVSRADVYATNAVKHFKHEQRGKRRLHKKPNTAEVEACHPWIDAETRGRSDRRCSWRSARRRHAHCSDGPWRSPRARGRRFEVQAIPALVTYHPSAVLRADEQAEEIRRALVDDLRLARDWSVT